MTTLSLKIENNLKENAQKMADTIGVSLSSLIKMLLKNVVRSGKLDIDTKPRYHGEPEEGDLDFENLDEAIKYIEDELEKKRKVSKIV